MPVLQQAPTGTAVSVILDTESIIRAHPILSQEAMSPTRLASQHYHMVVTASKGKQGVGTGNLVIGSMVGDTIEWFGCSESFNYDTCAVLVKIGHYAGDSVLGANTIQPVVVNRPAPPHQQMQQLSFYRATVVRKGREQYCLTFGIYSRSCYHEPILRGFVAVHSTIIAEM